jgi:hypothetical protein
VVVGDGMVRKVEYVKQGSLYAGIRQGWECHSFRMGRTGGRASVRALKRRNGR